MKGMKKRTLTALTLVLVLLSGCGAKSAAGATAPEEAPAAKEESANGFYDMDLSDDMVVTGSTAEESRGTGGSVYRDENAKLIREASLRIQTMEFDQTVLALETMVQQAGGYFENASVHGGGYRDVNAQRFGEYTVRIPAEKYDSFLGKSGELGYVTYRNETTEDIGERYYDTEARLKTQKTKQERLLELLSKAESMEDIIALENALSEVEYEIEQLTSTLNRYDSLVGFSTIYLTLNEVHKVSNEPGVTNSLGQRMASGFASSLENLVEGFQNTLVWFSYNVFGILMAAAVLVAAAVTCRKKKIGKTGFFRKKHQKENNKTDE